MSCTVTDANAVCRELWEGESGAQEYLGPGLWPSSLPYQQCAHKAYGLEDNEWASGGRGRALYL